MDKKIIVGLVAGVLLGLLEKVVFRGGSELIIVPALLGAAIGFAQTHSFKINQYLLGTVLGALFFIIIAFKSRLWADDIVTGALTGLVISFIITLINKKGIST